MAMIFKSIKFIVANMIILEIIAVYCHSYSMNIIYSSECSESLKGKAFNLESFESLKEPEFQLTSNISHQQNENQNNEKTIPLKRFNPIIDKDFILMPIDKSYTEFITPQLNPKSFTVKPFILLNDERTIAQTINWIGVSSGYKGVTYIYEDGEVEHISEQNEER